MVAAETRSLRVVVFGTPEFAVPALDRLLRSHHIVLAVITQPDRPRGRGQHMTPGPVKEAALAARIAVLQPDRLSDETFQTTYRSLQPDLGVVAAYGRILPAAVLNVPRHGLLNIHASLLPKYRGAAPIHRAIIAGERQTGVTIMRVEQQLDAGPMLAHRVRPIGPDDTSVDVERDLAVMGAEALLTAIDDVAAGRAIEIPQDDRLATYAHRLTREDGRIDWREPAAAVHNRVRGLHPWPHAFTYHGNARYLIHRTRVGLAETHNAPPGTVVRALADDLIIATGQGAIRVLEIQPEGGRPMSSREFLAGHRLTAGARFHDEPSM